MGMPLIYRSSRGVIGPDRRRTAWTDMRPQDVMGWNHGGASIGRDEQNIQRRLPCRYLQ